MKRKRILGISGSTKSRSTSLSILKFLAEEHKELIDLNIYDQLSDLPHFNPEMERSLPSSVINMRKQIENSDGVLFCTPEYVFSLPGSLKNLIEWTVSTVLFSSKPVAIIVAAASGKKAFDSLELILTTIETSMPDKSKLLIKGAKGKISENGNIIDPVIKEGMEKVVLSLLETISKKNRSPTKYDQ